MNDVPIIYGPEVQEALQSGQPVVALESTVIAHGLPYPDNVALAQDMETAVRDNGAVPATIALLEGVPKIGIDADEMEQLGDGQLPVRKISRRDFGAAIAQRAYGATTVAGTMILARRAGIHLFATGGIGGVHRGPEGDVSADLIELSRTPVAVVCAGAKAILDLPRTLEWLETFGVPVLGYQTDEFPAFYTPSSGLSLTHRVDSAEEAAQAIAAQWAFGLDNGVLVPVPIPVADALDTDRIERDIQQALAEAEEQAITGPEITPFLLQRLAEITGGDSVRANVALLKHNAATAAQIAVAFSRHRARRPS